MGSLDVPSGGGESMFGVRRALLGIKPNFLALPRTSLGIFDGYPISGDFVKRSFSSKEVKDEWVEDFNQVSPF